MRERRDTYRALVRKPEGMRPLERPRIILKWIFERLDERHRLDRSGLEQGQTAGSCECGDEPSSSTKYREFLG
jgi:hypothetical protein